MNLENDELMEKMIEVVNNLPDTDRRVLMMDTDNDYDGRNYLLEKEYGLDKKQNRENYIRRLKLKVRQLVEGTYKPRKTKFDKFKN